jgi:hypothetical protein
MEPSDYDKIPLCKILYFVRGTGGTQQMVMVAVHGSPCAQTQLILLFILIPIQAYIHTTSFVVENPTHSRSMFSRSVVILMAVCTKEVIFSCSNVRHIGTLVKADVTWKYVWARRSL